MSSRKLLRLTLENLEDRRVMTDIAGAFAFSPTLGRTFQIAENSPAQEVGLPYGARVTEVDSAQHGTVQWQSPDTITYLPAKDFRGRDSFEFSYVDYRGETVQSTMEINVVQSNYAIPDWMRMATGAGPTSIHVLANDFYFDRVTLPQDVIIDDPTPLLTNVTAAQNGSVSISEDGKSLIYTPRKDFAGIDTFEYTTFDHFGNESTGIVHVEVTHDVANPTYNHAEHAFIDALSQRVQQHRHQFGGRNHYLYYHDFWEFDALTLDSTGLISNARLSSTGTNIQVAGVDEGDIVKHLGDRLFVAADNELKILNTSDALAPKLIETIQFDDAITELYAFEDRVTVITASSPNRFEDANSADMASHSFSIHVLDVANLDTAHLVYSTTIDGQYEGSRFIDGRLYLVGELADSNPLPHPHTSEDNGFMESISDYVSRSRAEFQAPTFTIQVGDQLQKITVDWQDVPLQASPHEAFGAIFTFDTTGLVGRPIDVDYTTLGPYGVQIYASQHAFYLLQNSPQFAWPSFSTWSISTSSVTGNRLGWWDDMPNAPQTSIQKFDLHDDGRGLELAAKGSVSGHLSDQFSADEHEGYFRIATTEFSSKVNLFVMQQQGNQLEVVGSLEDIAPGEQIYSTRFDGDRGFVTTYRKVDPLFVIDLSDPQTPTIEGALKIPSYSNYMQVIDQDYILGIGRDANDGLYDGLQVSLFNVSDPANPQLVAKYEFAGGRDTWSPIADAWNLLDHHGVTFVAESGVLAISTHTNSNWGGGSENGTDEAISVLRIDVENEQVEQVGQMDFDQRARRSLHVDGYLYGISESEIQVAELFIPGTTLATVDLSAGDAKPLELLAAADPMVTSQPTDVDGDGVISPMDALLISNVANQQGFGEIHASTHPSIDVDGDGAFSPRDFVLVVNELTTRTMARQHATLVNSFACDTRLLDVPDSENDQPEQEKCALDTVFAGYGSGLA